MHDFIPAPVTDEAPGFHPGAIVAYHGSVLGAHGIAQVVYRADVDPERAGARPGNVRLVLDLFPDARERNGGEGTLRNVAPTSCTLMVAAAPRDEDPTLVALGFARVA